MLLLLLFRYNKERINSAYAPYHGRFGKTIGGLPVIEFSGTNSNENVTEHEDQLMSYIEANQIKIIGSPKYAFYNAPWTLPFLRRNEVMIEINKQF